MGRKFNDPPRPLGGSTLGGAGTGVGAGGAIGEEEQRERMLRAAEERVKAVSLHCLSLVSGEPLSRARAAPARRSRDKTEKDAKELW